MLKIIIMVRETFDTELSSCVVRKNDTQTFVSLKNTVR